MSLTELRMAHQSQDIPAVQTALDISMLLEELLLKQCYAQNKVRVKLSQKVMLKGDDVQDVDYEEVQK
jgi:molecular chaperone DnaK